MAHKFVACDAARERKNRAFAFANQLAFKHAMVQHSWATLDIDDESTWEYINRMECNELERAKFEADVLANNIQPNIKFLKAVDNPLPFVVKLRAPRECDFNPQYQQSSNNWTRQNFAEEQNYDHEADNYQEPQHSNYPMQQYFSGPSQTVPPMAVPIPSAPVGYVPVNHGYNNAFSAAPMQNGHFQSNQPNGGYYPSPTESRDSGVYTSSPSNGYGGSQNIQYIPASYPCDVSYASVIPPGEPQIHYPSQGVPPQSAEYQQRDNNWTRHNFAQEQNYDHEADTYQEPQHSNYPMQQYCYGPSQAVPRMAGQIPQRPFGYAPWHGSNNTCSTAPMQNGYFQSNQPNDDYYPSPTESRDSGVYTSSPSHGSEGCQNVQQVLASSPSDEQHVSALPSGMDQIHDPSPSRSRRQNTYRKKQTLNAKPRIRTTIEGEPNSERNPQIVCGQHGKPQSVVGVDNGNKDTPQKVSKNVATLPVALKKPAESLESTNFDTEKVEKQDTSDEATVTVAKQRNSEAVLPTAPESAEFVEEVKPPSIGTPVEDKIQTTTGLELEKDSSIVTDDVSVASDTDLNCDVSNSKSTQAMERSDVDAEGLKDQYTSDEATLLLLPHASDSAKFVVEAKLLPSIGTTVRDNIQTTTEFELEKESPIVTDDVSGASNRDLNCELSKLDKPLQSTETTDFDTDVLKDQFTSDEATVTLLPHAPDSAKFVVEAKLLPSIETTAECDIQTTTELPVEMSEILLLQHEKPQSIIGMENGKNDQKLQISQTKDVDTRPNVAEDMTGVSNTESDPSKLEKPVMSTPIKPSDVETKEHKGHTTSDDGATEPNISEFIDEMVEDPEFPALASKALDSVEKCSNNADVAVVEKEKPSKPLMSEVLLAAIKKDVGTVNPCWNAVPIVQQYPKQLKNKNLTDTDSMTTKSQGSKPTPSYQIRKSQEPFRNKKPEAPNKYLSANQKQDSNSGWKTVKSSSKDTNNTEKLAVPAEQPPVAKEGKKSPSSEKQKGLTTASSISPTLKTEQSVKENLAESTIDTPDQPEKSQVSKSSQKKSMKNKKKDKKPKTAKPSVIEDFDTLLEQFKEEDKKSAEKNGEVREVVSETANGNRKKRTIRQYQEEKWQYEAEKEEAERNGQELIDWVENEEKRMEISVNFGLPLFFVELEDCVKNRSPMFNWPECPVRDRSESEETTRQRDELVLRFINIRISRQYKKLGTILQDSFYSFLGRHYQSNVGPILEPLARLHKEREITIDDELELIVRMLNKREHRAEWNELNFHCMKKTNMDRYID
ncbi:hypothetical protein B9Z55_028088 [Caenorhabditis nigoni]|uniref:Uncharacterized protein n=1 Tax=Caenorhabditis nigoni TaxID=1611254 RepID=A0A2G5SDK7_9PELO|nr:hypothetical protein B9Z55_028088 [Caenorhabditis nigoni]